LGNSIEFGFLFVYIFFFLLQDYPVNPKALSLGELYGEFNLATNEWADGVLSSIMRIICAGEKINK
jgi:dynein heavy chain, axonemal